MHIASGEEERQIESRAGLDSACIQLSTLTMS